MKNYYEILEVSQNASIEVIEKAYKALAKKYHPDLQNESDKKLSEEKFKEISEAYEILSNEDYRKKYDLELSNYKSNLNNDHNHDDSDYENLLVHTQELEDELENLKRQQNYINQNDQSNNDIIQNNIDEITNSLNETIQKAYSDAYHDAYIDGLSNFGYTKKRKTFKTYFKNFVALIITILIISIIIFILLQIPFTRNYFINMYNNNKLLQILLNPFIKY